MTHKIPSAEVLVGCFFRRPVLLYNVFPAAWRAMRSRVTEASPVIPAIGVIYLLPSSVCPIDSGVFPYASKVPKRKALSRP